MQEKSTIINQRYHSSVRDFQERPVDEALCRQILEATTMASSSCFMQATSIIRVTDQQVKAQIADWCGQPFIKQAPQFWVFCGDLHRGHVLNPDADLGWTDLFLTACLDTGIMVQNAMVALESLGLGGVFVGGIRDCIEKVSELLKLPEHTVPFLGLAFGYPVSRNECKPRLPHSVTVMENVYCEPNQGTIAQYDALMHEYYTMRASNKTDTTWTKKLRSVLIREQRPFLKDYLKKQKLNLY